MVLDSSAILAILLDEPERQRFARLIEQDPARLVSAATLVEVSIVIESRKGEAGRRLLERFLELTGSEVVPFTADQAELASDAFRRWGKGRHPAGLNFGDVFAYALAEITGEPLLFKGNDFARTNIASAA
jgi:ribonuclease VapC